MNKCKMLLRFIWLFVVKIGTLFEDKYSIQSYFVQRTWHCQSKLITIFVNDSFILTFFIQVTILTLFKKVGYGKYICNEPYFCQTTIGACVIFPRNRTYSYSVCWSFNNLNLKMATFQYFLCVLPICSGRVKSCHENEFLSNVNPFLL